MKFATQYEPNGCIPEKNSGKKLVETIGYISAEKRINNLLLAGQRLQQFRQDQFDFPDEKSIDDEFFDPTRSKNFDMADATQMSLQAHENLIKSKRAKEMALKEQETAKETAQEAPEEPKKPE